MSICFAAAGIVFLYGISARIIEFIMAKVWSRFDDQPTPWKARLFAVIEVPAFLYVVPIALLMYSTDEWMDMVKYSAIDIYRHFKGEWR